MIDQIIFEHLLGCEKLKPLLTIYDGMPAVFNQKIPTDADSKWERGMQYPRIVISMNVQRDSGRTMGGNLAIDVHSVARNDSSQMPESFESIVRSYINGYFFSDGDCTMAAQWVNSRYFTEANEKVSGVTLMFNLLAFPLVSATGADVTGRANEWTAKRFPELLVINHDTLPNVWRPSKSKSAVYWRVASVKPARWIPDTFQTVWRTANLRCHVFATDINTASDIAQKITLRMYADKRLLKQDEAPIMVNRDNSVDTGADALRTGQVSIEATFGEIVYRRPFNPLNHINYV